MPYYRKCPLCGATLDPGERCDCQDKETAPDAATSKAVRQNRKVISSTVLPPSINQIKENFKYDTR